MLRRLACAATATSQSPQAGSKTRRAGSAPGTSRLQLGRVGEQALAGRAGAWRCLAARGGPESSADPRVMQRKFRQMRERGIEFLVMDDTNCVWVDHLWQTYSGRATSMRVGGRPVLHWCVEKDVWPEWSDARRACWRTCRVHRDPDEHRAASGEAHHGSGLDQRRRRRSTRTAARITRPSTTFCV